MSRIIDADALKEALDKAADWHENYPVVRMKRLIDRSPTAVVDNYAMGYQDGVRKVLSEVADLPTGLKVEEPKRMVCADGIVYIIEEEKTTKIILNAEFDNPISLEDIAQKYPKVVIVLFEDFLNGKVFRYNNYGKGEWCLVGRTIGFA